MTPVELDAFDSGGGGEPVILSHAIGCDARMWLRQAAVLRDRFRVLAFDTRGHGQSPVTPRPYSLDGLADDFARELDRRGLERAHWVGLSMGGMIGQAFALRHPGRLMRLVLANTSSSFGSEGRAMWHARAKAASEGGMAAIRDAAMARYFSEAFRASNPAIVAVTAQRFLETSVEGYAGCCDALAALDFTSRLGGIKARTLVIAGELDAGTPVAMSQVIVDGITDSRLAVIAGAAHLSAVEKPDEFNALVRPFLATT
ncbi:MAG: 3-oxoadipate enol-lactonase [Usitatibacter sp.]